MNILMSVQCEERILRLAAKSKKEHLYNSYNSFYNFSTCEITVKNVCTYVKAYCLVYWEEGLQCALIKCTLGSGKSKKDWEFGGKGTREQGGTRGASLQATREGGGRFLSQLEGAK
jgi:hypothetical protein